MHRARSGMDDPTEDCGRSKQSLHISVNTGKGADTTIGGANLEFALW